MKISSSFSIYLFSFSFLKVTESDQLLCGSTIIVRKLPRGPFSQKSTKTWIESEFIVIIF